MSKVNTNIQLANKNIYVEIKGKNISLLNSAKELNDLLYSMFNRKKLDDSQFRLKFINVITSILNGVEINHINIYNLLQENHNENKSISTNRYKSYYEDDYLNIMFYEIEQSQALSDVIYALCETLNLLYRYYANV